MISMINWNLAIRVAHFIFFRSIRLSIEKTTLGMTTIKINEISQNLACFRAAAWHLTQGVLISLILPFDVYSNCTPTKVSSRYQPWFLVSNKLSLMKCSEQHSLPQPAVPQQVMYLHSTMPTFLQLLKWQRGWSAWVKMRISRTFVCIWIASIPPRTNFVNDWSMNWGSSCFSVCPYVCCSSDEVACSSRSICYYVWCSGDVSIIAIPSFYM